MILWVYYLNVFARRIVEFQYLFQEILALMNDVGSVNQYYLECAICILSFSLIIEIPDGTLVLERGIDINGGYFKVFERESFDWSDTLW